MMDAVSNLELEPANPEFQPVIDRRPRVPEPLPVRIVAIAPVRLPAPAGAELALDAFYVKLLGLERIEPLTELIYRAENYELRFDVKDRPVTHDSLRALVIEVMSLREAEEKLIAAEMVYTRQRGTAPGTESIVMLDPAGNWIELVETRVVP
jgi:hypothetical protein